MESQEPGTDSEKKDNLLTGEKINLLKKKSVAEGKMGSLEARQVSQAGVAGAQRLHVNCVALRGE